MHHFGILLLENKLAKDSGINPISERLFTEIKKVNKIILKISINKKTTSVFKQTLKSFEKENSSLNNKVPVNNMNELNVTLINNRNGIITKEIQEYFLAFSNNSPILSYVIMSAYEFEKTSSFKKNVDCTK